MLATMTQANIAEMLQGLLVPVFGPAGWSTSEEELLGDSMAGAFTGHSERCSLPSLAATLGMPKAERDFLGRWSPSGSDEYVRSAKVVMRRTIEKVVEAATAQGAYATTDESEAFETLGKKMTRTGRDKDEVTAEVEEVKEKARRIFDGMRKAREQHKTEEKDAEQTGEEGRVPAPVVVAPEVLDEPEEVSDKKALYVAAVARRNNPHRIVTTLHSCVGCYRGRMHSFRDFELLFEEPSPGQYDEVCRSCWPSGPPTFNQQAKGTEETDASDDSSSSS